MTAEELAAVIDGIAPVIQTALQQAVTGLQARLDALGDLTQRLAAIEAQRAIPGPPGPPGRDGTDADASVALTDIRARMESVDRRVHGMEAFGERIAVLETRAPVPGPPGKDGRDGLAGADGLGFEDLDVTFDGDRTLALTFTRGDRQKAFPIPLPFLRHCGIYTDGVAYAPGDVVTWAGSAWHCREATTVRPGDGLKAWTLIVKRGRDGKDGKDGPRGPDGPAGKDWQQVYDTVRSR
jgi:hypothetical protein